MTQIVQTAKQANNLPLNQYDVMEGGMYKATIYASSFAAAQDVAKTYGANAWAKYTTPQNAVAPKAPDITIKALQDSEAAKRGELFSFQTSSEINWLRNTHLTTEERDAFGRASFAYFVHHNGTDILAIFAYPAWLPLLSKEITVVRPYANSNDAKTELNRATA